MSRKFLPFVFFVSLCSLFFVLLTNPNQASAQTCTGTFSCCTQTYQDCKDSGGNPCTPPFPGCVCTTKCGRTQSYACNGITGENCSIYIPVECKGFYSGSCVLQSTPPPTSTPFPTSGPTPPPTPPPPADNCTGSSFCAPGIPNCGTNGWQNGTGTCTGGICCTTGGGALPSLCDSMDTVWTPASRTINIGQYQTAEVTVRYRSGGVPTSLFVCIASNPNPVLPLSSRKLDFEWQGSGRDGYCLDAWDDGNGEHTFVFNQIWGLQAGTQNISSSGAVGGTGAACPGWNTSITVVEPPPPPPPPPPSWWQVIGGDVISSTGRISSAVPSGSMFMLNNSAGSPGIPISNKGLNVASGTVSSKNWSVQSQTSLSTSYAELNSLLPSTATINPASYLTTGDLASATATNGYYWFKPSGNVTLDNNITLSGGQKVILFVDGDLHINANIRLVDPKKDFFMAIVSGSIIIDNSVTNTGNPTPPPTPSPTPSPTPTPNPNILKAWEFTTDTEGWTVYQDISNLYWNSTSNGRMTGDITGPNPAVRSVVPLGLNINSFKTVVVGLRNFTPSTTAQICFITEADQSWNSSKCKNFTIQPNNTGIIEYAIDMSTVAEWTGTLRRLRLYPEQGAAIGGSGSITPGFTIDYIRIQNSPVLSRTTTNLALEGIFFAGGTFDTGTGSNQLSIRGSVVANSVTIGRDLGSSNTSPATTFEFSEEIFKNYPSSLAPKKLIWREVNP